MKVFSTPLQWLALIGFTLFCQTQTFATLHQSEQIKQTTLTTVQPVTLYLVRHGKTMLNATHRVQGWSDAILTQQGIEVANALGRGIKKQNILFTAAYSSDSGRSIQTANLILKSAHQAALPLNTDWRLREFNFGTYEGELNPIMWRDIAQHQGTTLEAWQKNPISPKAFANSVYALEKSKQNKDAITWPAENYDTISQRLKNVTQEIVEAVSQQGGGNVLVVSHGLSIVALINTLDPTLNAPAGLDNASVTKVRYHQGKYQILSINDTHLSRF